MDTVTLFGIGLAAAFAVLTLVSHWFGWRFVRMVFASTTVTTFAATVVYLLGLPKPTVTVVTAVTCSILFANLMNGDTPTQSPYERWRKRRERERTEQRADAGDEHEPRRTVDAAPESDSAPYSAGGKWKRELDAALHK